MVKKGKILLVLLSAVSLGFLLLYGHPFKVLPQKIKELQPSNAEQRTQLPNSVKSSLHTEPRTSLPSTIPAERLHVIITFRLLNITNEHQNARMKEYIDCLKNFLNNSNVKHVHLMHDSPEMPGYIQKEAGAHPKLLLHRVDSPDVVLTLHQFAFTHLQGEVVVITQADIILGEGFEKVKRSTLSENRLLYGLSRHVSNCKLDWNQCKKYLGSHDLFIFVPQGNLTKEAQDILSHHVYYYGTENVVLHVYHHILKYRILNPCKVLKSYHHHCSGFRAYPTQQKRINGRMSQTSRPTSALE